jgi:hypothetical protein
MYEHAKTNDGRQSNPVRRLVRRRPITMFLVIALGLSWPVMIAVLASSQDISPGILLMVIFLLGGAMLVTALSEGRAGVRRLFAGNNPVADGPCAVPGHRDRHAPADAAGRRADRYPPSPGRWLAHPRRVLPFPDIQQVDARAART